MYIKGCVPARFKKKATVIPIHKSGDTSLVDNFSPLSVLLDISKVSEGVLYKKLWSYLSESKILHDDQYGFRKNRSKTDALLNQTQYLFDSIDSGFMVFSLFLDFKRAFDSLDNNVLVSKLCFYGFRCLPYDLLKSY